MAKQGTEYELFVKEVYEILNQADGLDDINIQHDVRLKGISGVTRQIDIYWTFYRGEINYKVAIECKDYNRKVSIDKISAFHDLIQDLGNTYGVFVSKVGFQSGAIEYAQKCGIQLMEIRHPTNEDWSGRIRDIQFQIIARSIGNISAKLKASTSGNKIPEIHNNGEIAFRAQPNNMKLRYKKAKSGAIDLPDKEMTVFDLIKQLPMIEAGKNIIHSFSFEDGNIQIEESEIPITEIEFTYDVYESISKSEIIGDKAIMALVKNITDGTEKTIDSFKRVSSREKLPS